MVRSSVTAESLIATIDGENLALWLRDANEDPAALTGTITRVFGRSVRRHLPDRGFPMELSAEASAIVRSGSVQALSLGPAALAEVIDGRQAQADWSPSVQWLHAAGALAIELIATHRVLPVLHTHGLRWRASWSPVNDDASGERLTHLVSFAPPVVFMRSDTGRLEQATRFISSLVDALARRALSDADWRPPLQRSRASAVVALRRFTGALQLPDAVFVGDSVAHEQALSVWSHGLGEVASVAHGAPEVRFQARITPPHDSEYWLMVFEVVRSDGKSVGFDEIWTGSDAAIEFAEGSSLAPLRVRMHQLVERLATQLAVMAPLADDDEPAMLALSTPEVADFLAGPIEVCRQAGLAVVIPADLTFADARLTAQATARPQSESHGFAAAILDVDWGLALGGVQLTPAEIERLARSKADLVAIGDSWVQIDRTRLTNALERLETQRRTSSELTPAELLRETVSEFGAGNDDDFSADGPIAQLLDGLPDDRLEEAHEPPGFVGELRPYQRRALSWLQFLGRLGLGGCLADDMGLGKTPTALAHLLGRTLGALHAGVPHRPHLVVCPLSVVANWEAETARFTPELSVLIAHGPERPRGDELQERAGNHDIVITTYGTASRIAEELEPIEWDIVVCDEAQAVKNHQTNAARAVRLLRAQQRVALTGTPVENRLTELWSILDAMNPGMLGGITWFRRTFAAPIDAGDDSALASLRRLTTPFLLRRTKSDRSLVPDLPDKVEQIAWATLSVEQAALYQAIVDDFLGTVADSSGMERRGLVLATLTRLKQVCNHPAHVLHETEIGDGGRSGKLERFDELAEGFVEAGDRTIVFTQYREMGLLLQTHLSEQIGSPIPFLHGGTTRAQRDRMVQEFQASDGPPILLISLRAGGTGLNLTAASRVIHYDRWWNPAVEDQATDRSWRIGQTKTVFVHKLVCQGTLEERIDALLTEKRSLANAVVGSGDAWLTELSTDELRDLLRLDPSATPVPSPAEVS